MASKDPTDKFTSIGNGLFRWIPLRNVSCTARWLWLSCYAGDGAKRSVPGLWPGTLNGMSEAAEITRNDTFNALEELVTKKLVTFDAENRLLRYLEIPDAHDRAHTWQAIKGWWGRFRTLPSCPQRDAHVPLLKWMIEQGEVNEKMGEHWSDSFGRIAIPPNLPSFRSPSSNDTGTAVQPSLFGKLPESDSISNNNKNKDLLPTGLARPLATPVAMFSETDPESDLVLGRGGGSDSGTSPARPRHLKLCVDLTSVEKAAAAKSAEMRDLGDAAGIGHLFEKTTKI